MITELIKQSQVGEICEKNYYGKIFLKLEFRHKPKINGNPRNPRSDKKRPTFLVLYDGYYRIVYFLELKYSYQNRSFDTSQ